MQKNILRVLNGFVLVYADAVPPVQPVEFSTIAADPDVLTAVPRAQSRKRRGGATNSSANRGNRSRSKRIKPVSRPDSAPQAGTKRMLSWARTKFNVDANDKLVCEGIVCSTFVLFTGRSATGAAARPGHQRAAPGRQHGAQVHVRSQRLETLGRQQKPATAAMFDWQTQAGLVCGR